MKRTKAWWRRLNKVERSYLVLFERLSAHPPPLGGGGYLPDDCGECPLCGNPALGGGACRECGNQYDQILAKANQETGDASDNRAN